MWRSVCLLALCWIPVLWADVCEGLPGQGDTQHKDQFWPFLPPNTGIPAPVSYRVSVKDGGPVFRITVRVVSPLLDLNQSVHVGDVQVARCSDGKRLTSLPFFADQPLNFGSSFKVEDINFDGYFDFSILTDYAAAYSGRSYWVYDPRSGIFVENQLTRELAKSFEGQNIDFDPQRHEMSAGYFQSSCPAEGLQIDQYVGLRNRYLVRNNRPILVHKEEVVQGGPESLPLYCTVRVSDLIGGTWRVTGLQRWRFNAQGEPIGTYHKNGRY
jgi:hypothetical protein